MKKRSPTSEVLNSLTSYELCRFCDADENWIMELVEYGVLEPEGSTFHEWHFGGINIVRAKKAKRLQRDLGINTPGLAIVLDLLQEREQLLRSLSKLEAG